VQVNPRLTQGRPQVYPRLKRSAALGVSDCSSNLMKLFEVLLSTSICAATPRAKPKLDLQSTFKRASGGGGGGGGGGGSGSNLFKRQEREQAEGWERVQPAPRAPAVPAAGTRASAPAVPAATTRASAPAVAAAEFQRLLKPR